MKLLVFLFASCAGSEVSKKDYIDAFCSAVEACDLLSAYGYSDFNACSDATSIQLDGYSSLNDEMGIDCLQKMNEQTCENIVNQVEIEDCRDWLSAAESE